MINESVYMPLNHMMIPLEYQGKKMYSEFWVDPDAEEQSGERKGEKKIQFLFKMDIESLGFLEITLAAHNNQIDLSIYGPKGSLAIPALWQRICRISCNPMALVKIISGCWTKNSLSH